MVHSFGYVGIFIYPPLYRYERKGNTVRIDLYFLFFILALFLLPATIYELLIYYLCKMENRQITREDMWARQQISCVDVDYNRWEKKRKTILEMAAILPGCIFMVDVFKCRYDYASGKFAEWFGYDPVQLKNIQCNGDLIEENIHPDDRCRLVELQIKHSEFIYSRPREERNHYSTVFRFRMLNRQKDYINVISRQRVIQQDRSGKAWIIMGSVDISPDQYATDKIQCKVLNLKTGEFFTPALIPQTPNLLTNREKEILSLIKKGLLSKEIAQKLGVSIHTINNHRKNILAKLNADNAIEAINSYGL